MQTIPQFMVLAGGQTGTVGIGGMAALSGGNNSLTTSGSAWVLDFGYADTITATGQGNLIQSGGLYNTIDARDGNDTVVSLGGGSLIKLGSGDSVQAYGDTLQIGPGTQDGWVYLTGAGNTLDLSKVMPSVNGLVFNGPNELDIYTADAKGGEHLEQVFSDDVFGMNIEFTPQLVLIGQPLTPSYDPNPDHLKG